MRLDVNTVQDVALLRQVIHLQEAEIQRLHKRLAAVKGNRTVKKTDMVHNAWLPKMEIDPQTYAVRADGQLLTCEPATVLPMAQKYFLF